MLGRDFSLADCRPKHDAVFLGIGLAGVNALRVEGETAGVEDAVDFIAALRQSATKADIAVGRRVVVLGGGMTAIDAAVQAKLLGAEEVTICYRRGKEHMNASEFEQDLATSKGVIIRHWLAPKRIVCPRRQGGRHRGRLHDARRRPPDDDRRNRRHRRRSCLQGDRPDLRSLRPRQHARSNPAASPSMAKAAPRSTGVWAGGDCVSAAMT
jgi:NADPH-dependent glutamate synthase beta subunit-like oxidoreductase